MPRYLALTILAIAGALLLSAAPSAREAGPYLQAASENTETTVKRKRYVKRTKYTKRHAKRQRAHKRKRSARRYGGKVSRPAVSAPIEPVVVPTIATVPAPLVGGLPADFAEMPDDILTVGANRFDLAFGALTPAPPMPPPIKNRPRKWPTLTSHGFAGEVVIAFALTGLVFAAIAFLMAAIRQDNQTTERKT